MDVNRRAFTFGSLLFALTAACTGGTQGKALPVNSWWSQYRQRFLSPEGRIVDTGNGGISHSEGQGYGMMLALHAGDRDAFDAMASWTQATLARRDVALHSWRYDPSAANPLADPNNATDGDILIAWALGEAGKHWSNADHTARAAQIRAAIRQRCVVDRAGRKVLLPGLVGFEAPDAVTFNTSYYVWPALDRFAAIDGAGVWGQVNADGVALMTLSRFGGARLPTDWVDLSGRDAVAPARGRPPRFGFDAVRIALYAVLGNRRSLAEPIAAYWRGKLAAGQPVPAWIDVVTAEEAPYPVSSGAAAIIGRLLGTPQPTQLATDYYAASLQMLTTL